MNRTKIVALFLITFIILSSTAINITKQYYTLNQADKKNESVKFEINDLKKENINLKNQIEYATSSAYIDQQIRDKFGLGTENDVWLILPEEKKINLLPKPKVEDLRPVFLKWFDLFTK
jgi:cell division protein FtsB